MSKEDFGESTGVSGSSPSGDFGGWIWNISLNRNPIC